jgi:hypothetical protein
MTKIKYPRTLHLPYSLGVQSDDKKLSNVDHLMHRPIVVTEKMDGENTTMAKTYIHARSVDSNNHPSRNMVKGIWGSIKHKIPDGWRICGENLYAQHSIVYEELESYFNVFSIWNHNNVCLDWRTTLKWCEKLDLTPVKMLHDKDFRWDIEYVEHLVDELDLTKCEGLVVRDAEAFHYSDFGTSVAKWVRADHVQTDEHWTSKPIIPNKIKK